MILRSYEITIEHLNSVNLNHCSQACSKTASVKWPMLSPSKQIPVQLLLSNANSHHFFDSLMKNKLSQTTTTKLYPVKEFSVL